MRESDVDLKIATLKETIHEANILLADFKATIKEVKGLELDLDKRIAADVDKALDEGVRHGLEEYGAGVKEAMDHAVQKVFDEFDKLSDIVLASTKSQKRKGEASVGELIEGMGKRNG